jgi:hypothetical protein
MSKQSITALDQDFDTALRTFLHGKRKVSEGMHTFLRCLVVLFTTCAVAMAASYAVQLGETTIFKAVIILTAVGIECAVVFFSAVIYPKWVLGLNQLIAGVLLPLLSLFTVMSFMVSQQFAADHKMDELGKSYIQSLQSDAGRLSIADRRDRGSLQVTRDRIEEMFDRLSHVRGSSATAIYHYIGKTFGVSVETVVLLVRALWALCFVSLCVALDAFVDLRLYSKEALNRFIAEWHEEKGILERARTRAQLNPLSQETSVPRGSYVNGEAKGVPHFFA